MFKAFLDYLLPSSTSNKKLPRKLPPPEPLPPPPSLEELEDMAWKDFLLVLKFVAAIFIGFLLGSLLSHLHTLLSSLPL